MSSSAERMARWHTWPCLEPMTTCIHTGLPTAYCAHCRGLWPMVPEPFRPRPIVEHLDESTGILGTRDAARCAEATREARWRSTPARSQWRIDNALRGLKGLL